VVTESSVLRINICGKKPAHRKSANRYVQILERQQNILFILVILLTSFSYDSNGQEKSDLLNTIYRDIREIKQFEKYDEHTAILLSKKDNDSNEYAFVWLNDTISQRQLIILEKLIRDSVSPRQPKYLIKDTLTIQFEHQDDWISLCTCSQNNIYKPEILALVKAKDNVEYFTQIKAAWYADLNLGKIIPLIQTRKIKCINEDNGADCSNSE
jgi:hypothetical protein